MEEHKAFIFRYYADTLHDRYFCDDGLISDPDFFVNKSHGVVFPVWAICGVFHRARLKEGDMVFFLPAKKSLDAKGITPYICTGVLVVGEVLQNSKRLQLDSRFSKPYKRLYTKDLRNHLRADRMRGKPTTEELRPSNIVVGDPVQSKWFGPNAVDFQCLLAKLGMSAIAKVLPRRNNRNMPTLTQPEMKRLYDSLTAYLPPIQDSSHLHPNSEGSYECRSCFND